MMSGFTYTYAPLAAGHIRLLRLDSPSLSASLPGHPAPDGSIRATLTHYDLSSPSRPPYTALSYNWGDDKERLHPPQTLKIMAPDASTRTFPIIQSNLYFFLRQVRPGPLPTDNGATTRQKAHVGYLWVDAICINQTEGGEDEKTAQLTIMSQIYASASRIVIWLGPAQMNTIDPKAAFPKNLWPAYPTGHAMDVYKRVAAASASDQLPKVSPTSLSHIVDQVDCVCIEAVTGLSYWKRAWIYQEASTPSVPREFWIGEYRLSFEDVHMANSVFHSHMLELGLNAIPSPSPFNVDIGHLHELTEMRRRTVVAGFDGQDE